MRRSRRAEASRSVAAGRACRRVLRVQDRHGGMHDDRASRRVYRGRTAVEREFGRLKNDLGADAPKAASDRERGDPADAGPTALTGYLIPGWGAERSRRRSALRDPGAKLSRLLLSTRKRQRVGPRGLPTPDCPVAGKQPREVSWSGFRPSACGSACGQAPFPTPRIARMPARGTAIA